MHPQRTKASVMLQKAGDHASQLDRFYMAYFTFSFRVDTGGSLPAKYP